MNGLPYYKAYPRDFIEGTIGMPFEIKCAYRVVLDIIYMQGGSLPDDARYISGLLGCSIRKWKSIRSELVDGDKLQVSGEFLTNYRAEKELESLSKLQEKQAENRSKPNKNNNLPKPKSDHTEPDTEDTSVSSKSARAFDQFWAMYPHKVGKADAKKKFTLALKRVDLEILMAGLRRYVAKTDDRPWCNPATWLNQDRWADQPAVVQPRGSPPQNQRGNPAAAARRRLDASENDRRNRPDHDDFEPAARLISSDGQRFG